MRLALTITVALSLVAISTNASATQNFPPEIVAHLGLSTTPDCSICHVGPQTRGTVTTPFGVTLRNRGLLANNIESLDRALDAISAEQADSDGDGVADIDELKQGTDPNAPEGDTVGPPEYGCSQGPAAPPSDNANAVALSALAAIALVAQRRRSARP